jgi:hypothetical protein
MESLYKQAQRQAKSKKNPIPLSRDGILISL